MSWIKIILINVVVLFILLILGSLTLRGWDYYKEKSETNGMFDYNTIRATYPNYAEYDKADALNLFTDYTNAGTVYMPFVEWRRDLYVGRSVNIEAPYHTRVSVGQKIDHSFWFFGGSTMWGSGANDAQTIPSYFAKISDIGVWNLGETAFNSFQELIQLQILLVNDLTPQAVIFYDGINDGLYCNANASALPDHSRADEYRERISKRPSKKVTQQLDGFTDKTINYIFDPYKKRLDIIFDKRSIGVSPSKNLSTRNPFSAFKKDNKYRVCGTDSKRAEKAARITINTWFLVHDLLAARDIPVLFVLQPTAHIGAEFHQLDYLLDSEKQRIVDEKDSYEAQYAMIRKIWLSECQQRNACENFLDLSHVFNTYDKPVFIDALHISPNGNKIVGEEIFKYMCSKAKFKVCHGE